MLNPSSPDRRNEHFASMSDSEDSVRNLKASQSVEAAFSAAGVPSPGGDLAAIISNYVKSETRGIPARELANMTPGSGPLATSAAAGVNQYLASLSTAQRDALKAGVNPLDPAAMQKFTMMLHGLAGHGAMRDGLAGNNGGRYAELRDGSASAGPMSAALGASYNALLKEGYKAAELKAILPYAKELGWTDRTHMRALADTGPEGGELAKKFEAAKKRGDKPGMQAAIEEAKKRAKEEKTAKKRRGYNSMQKIFIKEQRHNEKKLGNGKVPSVTSFDHSKKLDAAGLRTKTASNETAINVAFADLDSAGATPTAAPPSPPTKVAKAEPPKGDQQGKPQNIAKAEQVKKSGAPKLA